MNEHDDYLMRANDFLGRGKMIPVSRCHWYELIKVGKAPKPLKLGVASVWRNSDLQRFIRGEWKPSKAA